MDDRPSDQPSSDDARTTRHESGTPAAWPDRIGPYRVVSLIGEGAMGIVYEAEQQLPRRRVALKIIRPGVSTPTLLRRFEHEYEFLGRLQHPGIAQIHQAGVADTGSGPQPYFAMELERGRRLDEYARPTAGRARTSPVPERARSVSSSWRLAHHGQRFLCGLSNLFVLIVQQSSDGFLVISCPQRAESEGGSRSIEAI
jgi:serine/threonine protein kinase